MNTIMFTLTREEMLAVEAMADKEGLTKAGVFQQAIHLYQRVQARLERGEKMYFSADGEREALPVQGGEEERARIVTWLPIESAPKDGTKFDAWVPDAFGGHRMTNLSFNARGQLRQHGLLTPVDLPRWPTHWMPTPPPPAQPAAGEESGE